MEDVSIEKLQDLEIDEVAEILTDAFETNPAYSLVFTKKDHQKEGLFWLFRTSLILNNHKEHLTSVIKEKGTGKIIGTYTVIPPKGVESSILIYSKIGMIGFILKFGLQSLIRMLDLSDINKSALSKSIKDADYYYLSMVVIRKDYRGTGIGSYAIKYAIKEISSSNPTCKLIGLTTQLAENVTFYSRLGFEKLDEGFISFKGDKYYNYNLKLSISITK
jgi:hypothetical protein